MSEVKPREFWIVEDDSFLLTVSRNKPDEPYRIFHVIKAEPVLARIKELESLFSIQLDMVDKIELLERKLAKALEQRDSHLDEYAMPGSQKEFFDKQLEAIK